MVTDSNNPSALRIVLVDDHVLVRQGIKRLIETQPDLLVVAEASNATEAVDVTEGSQPDIVVMDFSLGSTSGVNATAEIRRRCPQVKILALTVHEDRTYINDILEAGAVGYIVKRAAGEELITALRAVATRGMYVDPRVAGKLISVVGTRRSAGFGGRSELSERETEVMRMIALGFTNKEISAKLGVSVKTVETYKARSMEKLGLRSRVDIVRHASERGWLTPPGA